MQPITKFLLILFILSITVSSANTKETAFVDIDYIIANSNIGKKVLEKIDKLDKKNIENLQKKNKSLNELEILIKNKQNVVSEEAFNKEVISFREKVQEFKNEKNQIVKNFNDYKKKELENIFKKIGPIINNYMEENSISVLFDSKNIFMGSKKSNLTEDILNRINKELK